MLVFVTGDTAPDLLGTIHDASNPDAPLDLTDSTVRFQMRKGDDRRFTVNAEAEVVDPAAGKVRYRWGTNDLSVHGEYHVQWEVTYPDARIQTTATSNKILVRRQ